MRTDEFIRYIKETNTSRGAIDAPNVLTAIGPSEDASPGERSLFADHLIEAAIGEGRLLTGVIARLLVQHYDGSQDLSGQAIKNFELTRGLEKEALQSLRIMIGGEVALEGIIHKLETNLDENFTLPIAELNEETRKMWQTTIRHAQTGFLMRIIMSAIVFGVGIILLFIAIGLFLFGDNITVEQMFGSGVSFVSGFSMILAVVYSGPLKEIRKSVEDMGTASAAFIAYVHRVLEISHTFSYYYLTQNMTFEEMKKSSDLIEEALDNTVKLLMNPKD